MWVTAGPLRASEALDALRSAVPDVHERERRGQLEIVDHDVWYLRDGAPDAERTLRAWIQRETSALASGYQGLRLAANTSWVEPADWRSFMEYESLVSGAFGQRRILALCQYCAARCGASSVLDVMRTHGFSITRRWGAWEIVESAQLRVAREDLSRARDAWSALQNEDRRKDELLATVGHELRNPLAPIRLALDAIQRRGMPGFPRELAIMDRQVRHMTKLVDDLLDVARANRDLALEREPVAIGGVLAQAIELIAKEVAEKNVTAMCRAEPGLFVLGDHRRLVQAIGNLLMNAAKHTAEGASIRIEAELRDDRVRIVVADDGPGVPPALIPRLFEPFVQGDQPVDRSCGGLGLGLAIVKRVVDAHGDNVEVSSAPGQGAAFTVLLPPLVVRRAVEPARTLDLPRVGCCRVLIVDDDADAAEMLRSLLETLDHEALIATHPWDAVTLLGREAVDLAFVDLGLPGIDGCALAPLLRARRPELTLVALSGYADERDRQRTSAAGFVAHLAKPASTEEIASVVARFANRGGG